MIYLNNRKIEEINLGASNLQEKTVDITSNSTSEIIPDNGYDGIKKATVNVNVAIPFDFSSIGYTGDEEPMKSGLAYAQKIKNEWNPNQTNLTSKFQDDKKLMFMPLVDTSLVTDMAKLFVDCSSLITLPQLNTSNVTSMSETFRGCSSLTTIPQLNTSKVTNFNNTFYLCKSLTTLPLLDISSCKSLWKTFDGCASLTSISLTDSSHITNMYETFLDCSSLITLPQLNTSNVADMSEAFRGCYSLAEIPQLNTSKVTSFSMTFYQCKSLAAVPRLDVSRATNLEYLFAECTKLRKIELMGFGTQPDINVNAMFGYPYNSIIGIDGDGVTGCRQALVDTLLTNSFDRATAGYKSITIRLSPKSKAVLTSEEISAIEAKGYTIATA